MSESLIELLLAGAVSRRGSGGRTRAALFGCPTTIQRVFGQGRLEQIVAETELLGTVINLENFAEHSAALRKVEVIFSTWGMPCLDEWHLEKMPELKAVFYAAGSVQTFARPLIERDILVVSAWQANAQPVAEFTLAQILLSTKGYFRNSSEFQSPVSRATAFQGPGNFGETIALLGAGAIGRRVIELLRPFHLKVIVFDPFLDAQTAFELDVERVTLEDAFRRGVVVSNHLADVPDTRRLLRRRHFEVMRSGATFLNTGRGATVDESGLIEVLRDRADLTALLDVTWPEPPVEGSPLYSMSNIRLSTHIAGSINDEFVRMADLCIEEFRAWMAGQLPVHGVSRQMLEISA